jgi:hypothetical protein
MKKDMNITTIKKNNKEEYSKATEFSKQKFWYYSNEEGVKNIYNSKSIWVRSIDTMNDLDEINLHKNECENRFALCFCNNEEEEIPMWYLYSGILGTGMSIGIVPSDMLRLISEINIIHPVELQVGDSWEPNKNIELKLHKDFDITYDWIYYYREIKDSKQIRYKKNLTVNNRVVDKSLNHA